MDILDYPLHLPILSLNIPILDFYLTECEMPVDTRAGRLGSTILQMACMMRCAKEADILRIVKWLVETQKAGTGREAAASMASQNGMGKVAAYLTHDDRQHKASQAEADLLAMLAAEEEGGDSKKKQHQQGRQKKKGKCKKKAGQQEQKAAGFGGKEYGAHMDDRKAEDERRDGEQEKQQDGGKPGAPDTAPTTALAGCRN